VEHGNSRQIAGAARPGRAGKQGRFTAETRSWQGLCTIVSSFDSYSAYSRLGGGTTKTEGRSNLRISPKFRTFDHRPAVASPRRS
jgi:hypothetical protein